MRQIGVYLAITDDIALSRTTFVNRHIERADFPENGNSAKKLRSFLGTASSPKAYWAAMATADKSVAASTGTPAALRSE